MIKEKLRWESNYHIIIVENIHATDNEEKLVFTVYNAGHHRTGSTGFNLTNTLFAIQNNNPSMVQFFEILSNDDNCVYFFHGQV